MSNIAFPSLTDEISIASLEQGSDKDPIWVLNASANSAARQAGEVHIGIPKKNGTKVDDLYLPMTWLPIRITDQIPRAQLMESSEFRNAVNNGLMQLISSDKAMAILAEDGAQEERERLSERARQIRDATAARTIKDSGAEVVSVQELADANRTQMGDEERDPNALDPSFIMFVNAIKDTADTEALNRIRGRGTFTRPEIAHMVKELKGKEKVVAFLKKALG
jgi:hypothetical protein